MKITQNFYNKLENLALRKKMTSTQMIMNLFSKLHTVKYNKPPLVQKNI